MEELPLVSIVMPVYNAEKYLPEVFESIKKQSYNKWELICCDDCSTDSSFKILKDYSRNDTRIKVLKNESNLRAAATRNKCISVAKGTFILLQDADDISLPNRIEILLSNFKKYKDIDFISSNVMYFDNDLKWKPSKKYIPIPVNEHAIKGLCYIHASTMFRKSCLEAVGGYRVSWETKRGQDYDMFMRMMSIGKKGMNISDILYEVREDQEAYSRRKYKYRIAEAVIRFKNYRKLKIPLWGYVYVLKPLIIGLVPGFFMKKYKELWGSI
ncbi:glycosyltransferase family 2 protein [Peribacillus simplex]|uniref:Glycosyltransferase 2-like domain-containing protein n=1 Tax=Peribacillus simplex NBRC 15720 = DSM 1321 TaxID=1349754 RepID=A0A223ELF3_9BACI|nr:glycosyltransferase [Peribacillus simplex]ASS96092.1 hypothetical protein BS1321_20570 [Peribacillus simplex NBRC 15720 = DSM 1321]MEC1397191.1 glycosyltransferase [Peribacillus simplex]